MARSCACRRCPKNWVTKGFRRAVLEFLTGELREKLLAWRHFGGFSAHNQMRVVAEDREGRMKLAGHMLRAPMSLEKMTYDDRRKSPWDDRRSRSPLRGKSPWDEHLVRYVGWYSNRARGERAKALKAAISPF